jgi:hypothetical protein
MGKRFWFLKESLFPPVSLQVSRRCLTPALFLLLSTVLAIDLIWREEKTFSNAPWWKIDIEKCKLTIRMNNMGVMGLLPDC